MPDSRRQILKATAAGLLAAMTPTAGLAASDRHPNAYLRTNWSRDPYALGAYSYLPKGVDQNVREALEAPISNRIYFAGEATHPEFNSTVHAAYASGLRAAQAILDFDHQAFAVIGAGISGLSAAHALSKEGRDVTVFEARNRIGGRIHTDRSTGQTLDLGASWIHGTQDNPLTNLADMLVLARIPTDSESYVRRGRDGQRIYDWSYPDALDLITEVEQDSGADADQLNMTAYEEASRREYEGPEVIFPDGFDRILKAFDGAFDLKLNAAVSAVRHDANAVHVETSDQRATFDAVIITLPLGVLKAQTVDFKPAFAASKRAAIDRLGMGILDKLYLSFEQPFWDVDKTWIQIADTDLSRGQFNGWLNLLPALDLPVLLAFNAGSAALALAELDDQALIQRAITALDGAYPI